MWDVASAVTVAWHVGYCGSGDGKVVREREGGVTEKREKLRFWNIHIRRVCWGLTEQLTTVKIFRDSVLDFNWRVTSSWRVSISKRNGEDPNPLLPISQSRYFLPLSQSPQYGFWDCLWMPISVSATGFLCRSGFYHWVLVAWFVLLKTMKDHLSLLCFNLAGFLSISSFFFYFFLGS